MTLSRRFLVTDTPTSGLKFPSDRSAVLSGGVFATAQVFDRAQKRISPH
jgi:hypothetical protein